MNSTTNSGDEVINTFMVKARQWCASEERCGWDIKQKLIKLDCSSSDISRIIDQLTQEGFIDEQRYAYAYASGKFRISKWGRVKIASGLRMKKIPERIIFNALDSIDKDSYSVCLKTLINKKLHELKSESSESKRQKLARFALQKGFESELVYTLLRSTEY
jgi:regulatory protein